MDYRDITDPHVIAAVVLIVGAIIAPPVSL